MINTRFFHTTGVLIALAVLRTGAGAAQDAPSPDTQMEFGAKLLVCQACHGQNGAPKSGAIPIIFGQQEDYLGKQIHDFQTGNRKVEVMAWMANTLTADEVGPATAYFAQKTWPKRAANAAAVAAPPTIAVCQSCHQADFMGAPRAEGMATPRLAGQSYDYLVEAMRRFADGERTNSSDMSQIMKAISPADREAMARYLSSL
jgi:cytochrome c553